MRKITTTLACISLLLSGCKHTVDTGLATSPRIPDLPVELEKMPESLPQIQSNTMGDLVIVGSEDDIRYNQVAHQLRDVITIYNCVKEAYNNKKEIKCQ